METIRKNIRVDFLDYAQDNWTQDFNKLKKQWLKHRVHKAYLFDKNTFEMYLNVVLPYGLCEWDSPQKVYNLAMRIIARDVVNSIPSV